MNYIEFASKISFFEFYQEEFYEPQFNTNDYKYEIEKLQNDINIDNLTKYLEEYPKIIDILEEIFQLSRFTNSQYINFCFDVDTLNNYNSTKILEYCNKSIFKFENNITNEYFNNLYNKLSNKESNYLNDDIESHIYLIKKTIITYIKNIINKKNRRYLYNHIKNSIGTRYRIARYMIESLKADQFLSSIKLEKFLSIKRKPIDTKMIHGNFGKYKIQKTLQSNNFINIDTLVRDKILTTNTNFPEKSIKEFSYLTERGIEKIIKRKDKREKIFDFILLYKNTPIILIETNFYSTSGTKIGINQGEYSDLLEDINIFNNKNNTNFKFLWITDGNYWLTSDGKNRFNNLKSNYFIDDLQLLNYNLFSEKINNIKKIMQTTHGK